MDVGADPITPGVAKQKGAHAATGTQPLTAPGDLTCIGVEEEFHVVDLVSRELVARGPAVLERLPADDYSHELHSSVVESNTAVCDDLAGLRHELVRTRRTLVTVAHELGLGIAAAGTVPLVDPLRLAVTPSSRYERMLDDYQLLVREQLICGTQVHVQVSDRDTAVAIAQRVTPFLPVLLALSTSSPYWMGEDSGYASTRSLMWQRWPTAGLSGVIGSAAEHDALVADLIASETITDAKMIYFDVRPSSHVPTLELRIPDACTDIDDVILLTGLFRALVRQQHGAITRGEPAQHHAAPLLRSALWRAARSGLEGNLVDLPYAPRPVPAATAAMKLVEDLYPHLEAAGDADLVARLVATSLARGSSAALQRAAYQRRGRLADVVDVILRRTDPDGDHDDAVGSSGNGHADRRPRPLLPRYQRPGDEVLPGPDPTPEYADILAVVTGWQAIGLRRREIRRDDEQRANGVTFGVLGKASSRLFPVDLLPRVVTAPEWTALSAGVEQRARALDAFLHDVYGERAAIADGIIPAWVVDGAPGLRSTGALMHQQRVRGHVCGMDLVRDGAGGWFVLEDNLRVPSGLGYALQNRRLSTAVLPDLPRPDGLLDTTRVAAMLRETLEHAALPSAPDTVAPVLLSEGPEGSAWFEHRMLGEEAGIPVALTGDLLVADGRVYLVRDGGRSRVDVLYLRIDEDALLHATGADGRPLGPQLLSVVAAGNVALVNAPGNGVGDDKAVYAFVPQLVEYYLGERPLLDIVPTFLCGIPEQLADVLARLDHLVLKPVDGYGGQGVMIGPYATEAEIATTRRQVRAAPHRWIAQEVVDLSTHPCFDGQRLVPRHVDLRVFALHGAGVRAVPAALTRVAPTGSMIVNSSRGGGSKDTWLLAEA